MDIGIIIKQIIFENWFVRYYKYLRTRTLHRETVKQLNTLTDRELKDIGITRCDINRLIWLEEDKSMRSRGKND